MNNEKLNFDLDFRVTRGSVETTFNAMKQFKEMGLANDRSNIVFNGVTVPAGHLESIEDFMGLYSAIINGNTNELTNYLGNNPVDANRVLNVCSREIKKLNKGNGLSPEEIDAIIDNMQPEEKSL